MVGLIKTNITWRTKKMCQLCKIWLRKLILIKISSWLICICSNYLLLKTRQSAISITLSIHLLHMSSQTLIFLTLQILNLTYSRKYQYQYHGISLIINIHPIECVILHQLHTSGVWTKHHNTATLALHAATPVLPQHHIYNNLCITCNRIAIMY